jgi:Calcineurin-like phosphoesterase
VDPAVEQRPAPAAPPPSAPAQFAAVAYDGPDAKPRGFRNILIGRAVGVFLLTAAAWGIGYAGGRSIQLSYATKALVLASISLVAAWWIPVLVANGAVAALLFAPLDRWRSRASDVVQQMILQLNRHAGHVEALFTWMVLAVVWPRSFWIQVLLASTVALFGPVLVDAAGWWRIRRRSDATRAMLLARRRIYIYGATVLGLGVLGGLAYGQLRAVLGLFAAILVPVLVRAGWYFVLEPPQDRVRARSVELAKILDRAVFAIGLAIGLLSPLALLRSGSAAESRDRAARVAGWGARASSSLPAERAPGAVGLFIVSDSQLHSLHGKRSGFQLDLVDAVVPVAVRPVELDLLSGVTLRRFAAMYRDLRAGWPELRWAHLGDIGDVACEDELDRFQDVVGAFDARALVSIAPGNHDTTFLGNLSWHPEWDGACDGRRADRDLLRRRLAAYTSAAEGLEASFGDESLDFFASVSRLGAIRGREVLGVFLDTTDYGAVHLGVAGAQGAVTLAQIEWVERALAKRPADAWVVVFMHHPVASLSLSRNGRASLERLARRLGDRLLAIVSAHTHLAAHRRVCLGSRLVDELVVGSTIDPPQEAALLEVRDGVASPVVHLRTLAAVTRPKVSCAPEAPQILASRCGDRVKELLAGKECAPLFGRDGDSAWHALAKERCKEVESPLGAPSGEVPTPEALDCVQQARAWRLLTCLSSSPAKPFPLEDRNVFRALESELERGDADRRELLVCTAWAASVLQGHKAQGWRIETALRFAYQDDATFGELDATAFPRGEACRRDADARPPLLCEGAARE